MPKRAAMVEKALGIPVPKHYADFLDTRGTYEADGVEVYGLDDGIVDQNKIPCVIGATRMLRKNANLPKQFLAIHHTGYEDEVVCLDSKTGAVFLFTQGDMSKIADSFNTWFSGEILGKKG
jgi:hypothetical protein